MNIFDKLRTIAYQPTKEPRVLVPKGTVRVFVFSIGGPIHGHHYYASALTEHGRWITHETSYTSELAIMKCIDMANRECPRRLSSPFFVIRTTLDDPDVKKALIEAEKRTR